MKILLTGSNGFLGRNIKDVIFPLITELHTINSSNSTYNCDLSEGVNLRNESYQIIIHTAGKAHQIPNNEEQVQEFYKVNVQGTANLLKALKSPRPPKSFIFISTVAVYGLNEGNLINEDAPLLARDPYGHSKIQAEQLVQEWCKKHGVICTILRLPLVVGSNPPGNLGAMIKGVKKGYYFNIEGGKARKSMVLADDIAMHILKIAEIGGIYNLTDGYHPNFAELGHLIAKQSGKANILNMPLVFAKIAAKIGDLGGKYAPFNTNKLNKITSTLTFDDSKARAAFGWNPTPVLEGFKINS